MVYIFLIAYDILKMKSLSVDAINPALNDIDSLSFVQTLRHSWKFLCKIAPSVGFCHFYWRINQPTKNSIIPSSRTYTINIWKKAP
jgi:hypothetical protein